MLPTHSETWISSLTQTLASNRRMIDATIQQLTDEELFARPSSAVNSVAIILRHLGGNLSSRWTDFLTTDGEKSDRNRDQEFMDWEGDRQSLMDYFNRGWKTFESALESLQDKDADRTIYIRGEAHSIAQALLRSITHLTYHVGQITMIARTVHQGPWRWLTIAPGDSASHNQRTWGTAASRAGYAQRDGES